MSQEDPQAEGLSAAEARDVATVAKGGGVQIAGQISARSLAFFFQLVATRVLGTAGFGLYALTSRILGIGGQLGLAGFNYATMRFITKARANDEPGAVRGSARVGLVGAAITSAIVFVVLMLFAEPIAGLFSKKPERDSELADLLRIGAAYVPMFAFMQVLRYCTQAYKTMVPSVIAGNIVQPSARFVLGIAAFVTGFEIAGAVATLAASFGVGAVVAGFYFRRMLTERQRTAKPIVRPGPMIRFALPQAGSSLLGIQALGLGVIVLGATSSNFQVGLFAIALALQGPGGVFLSGIVNIWAPVVSDLHEKGEIARLDSLYKTITRWVITFSFPVYAALVIEPDLFVRMFAPDSVERAAPVVAVVALGNFFYSGTGPTGYVLSMTGRPGLNFMNSVVAVTAYALLGAMVAGEHGALGIAWVDAGITAAVNSVRVIEAKFLVGVQPFGRSMLKPIGATAVGAGVLLAWKLIPDDSIPLEIAGLVVAGAAYFAVLAKLGLDPEERAVWDRIRRRALRR